MPWMRRLAGIARDRAHGLRRSATAWVAVRRATYRTAQHRRWSVAPVVGAVVHSSGAQTVVGVGIGMAVAAVLVHAYAAPGPAAPGPAAPAPRLEVALARAGQPGADRGRTGSASDDRVDRAHTDDRRRVAGDSGADKGTEPAIRSGTQTDRCTVIDPGFSA